MDLSGSKEFLFRHGEKLVLGLVILFVGYRVYLNLFGAEVVQPARRPVQRVAPPMPGMEIDASFWRTASPFLCPPPVEGARHNWFYPPKTHWGKYVELGEGKKGRDAAQVPVGRKVVGSPQVTALTEGEKAYLNVPPAYKELTQVCQIEASAVPVANSQPPSDMLVIKAVKAGFWARVMVMLENEDRFCVAVMVAPSDIEIETGLVEAKIEEIRERPQALGTVILRFNAPRGSKTLPGKVINYIEPTYFEVRRKGERDKEDSVIGKVPGRTVAPAEPGPGPVPAPKPKPDVPVGFPGSAKEAPPEPKGAPPTKGAPAADTGEMSFEDMDVEAEVTYTYFIRSVLEPQVEGAKTETRDGPPVSYKTSPRFTFVYLGGDAQHANIRIYIGQRAKTPEEKKLEEWRDYERVPIGGWVGEVPKEFRPAPEAAEGAGPEPGKGGPAKAKAASPAPGDGASARFVTRYVLVAIEQNVFRPSPQTTTRWKGTQRIVLQTYSETQGHRVVLRDPKNRLHCLWQETKATAPPVKGKEGGVKQ